MNQIINLTPHEVNIQTSGGIINLPPSGVVPRLKTVVNNLQPLNINGVAIQVAQTSFGDIENLPAPQPDTAYVVSAMVMNAVPGRTDLFAPGQAIRDDAGRIIGCQGLSRP